MKDQSKKILDLHNAIDNSLGWLVCGYVVYLVIFLFSIYVGGYPAGITSLAGAFIGDLHYRRKAYKRVVNPFAHIHGLVGSPTYLYREKEFYKKAGKYMEWAWPQREKLSSWKLFTYHYFVIVVFTLLFWNGNINVPQADILLATIVVSVVTFFLAMPIGIWIVALGLWAARDPEKISKFFGVPTKVWKPDLKPIKRPASITALMLFFYGIGAIGLAQAPATLIGKIFGIRVIYSLDNSSLDLLILSGGVAFIGAFFLAAGYGMQKMAKGGALIAIVLAFMGMIVAFPLSKQYFIPIYYAILVFVVCLGILYLIKRNWKKFRGW